jgi:hypothetical protein
MNESSLYYPLIVILARLSCLQLNRNAQVLMIAGLGNGRTGLLLDIDITNSLMKQCRSIYSLAFPYCTVHAMRFAITYLVRSGRSGSTLVRKKRIVKLDSKCESSFVRGLFLPQLQYVEWYQREGDQSR